MRTIELAKTGEQLSQMCLGTMMFGNRCDEAEADRILSLALEHGVNFLDTAAMYCDGLTEEILGRIMQGRRDQIFLATKVHKGVDAHSIRESMDESLARLQTDHVDLFLIHWPKEGMRPVEIMQTLNELVEAGKTQYVGCCNYAAWLFAYSNQIAERNGWAQFVCNQVPYNLLERGIEVEIIPQAATQNITLTIYRALAIGLLAGKYTPGETLPENSRGQTDQRIARWLSQYGAGVTAFMGYAAELGLHPAQLANAWVCSAAAVMSPIVGVSSLKQLEASLAAFDFALTEEQYAKVTAMFDTAVKEEAGGAFADLRRVTNLCAD